VWLRGREWKTDYVVRARLREVVLGSVGLLAELDVLGWSDAGRGACFGEDELEDRVFDRQLMVVHAVLLEAEVLKAVREIEGVRHGESVVSIGDEVIRVVGVQMSKLVCFFPVRIECVVGWWWKIQAKGNLMSVILFPH
jgi:hypothetical protein